MLLFVKISRTSNEKYSQFCFLLLYTLYTYKNNIFRISCFYNKKKKTVLPSNVFSKIFYKIFVRVISGKTWGKYLN